MRRVMMLLAEVGTICLLCGMPAAAKETEAEQAVVLEEAGEMADPADGQGLFQDETEDLICPEGAKESGCPAAEISVNSGAVSASVDSEAAAQTVSWTEKTAILDAVSVGQAYLQGGMQELADGLAVALENPGGTGMAELVAYSRSAQVYYQASVNSLTYAIELCDDREDAAFMQNSLIIYRNILSAFLLEPEITEDNVIDYPDDDYMDHAAELAAFITDVSRLWVEMEY